MPAGVIDRVVSAEITVRVGGQAGIGIIIVAVIVVAIGIIIAVIVIAVAVIVIVVIVIIIGTSTRSDDFDAGGLVVHVSFKTINIGIICPGTTGVILVFE
jgi:hypothetical protein